MEVGEGECPQVLLCILGLMAQGALPHALRMLMWWFGEGSVLVGRCGHPVVQGS